MEYVAAGSAPVVAISLPVSVRPGVVGVEVTANVVPTNPGVDSAAVKDELPAISTEPVAVVGSWVMVAAAAKGAAMIVTANNRVSATALMTILASHALTLICAT
jgi:hypothetical protein